MTSSARDLDELILVKPGPKPALPAALQVIADHCPNPLRKIHFWIERYSWEEFREIAELHERNASAELRLAIRGYVRLHRKELLQARRAAHQVDQDPTGGP